MEAVPVEPVPVEAVRAKPVGRKSPLPRRRAAVLAAAVVLGAAGCAGAAGLTWWTQQHLDTLAGSVTTRVAGGRLDPVLVPVAIITLAGFGAALSTSGWLRRLVGVVVVLGGASAGLLAVTGALRPPTELTTDLARPVTSSAAPMLHPAGPVLAAVGSLLVILAGVVTVAGLGLRGGLGQRYESPTRRGPPRSIAGSVAEPVAGPVSGTIAGSVSGAMVGSPGERAIEPAQATGTLPVTTSPAASATVVRNPEAGRSSSADPDLAHPDLADPDLADPDLAGSDLAHPDLADPDLADPDLTDPDQAAQWWKALDAGADPTNGWISGGPPRRGVPSRGPDGAGSG